MPTNEGFSKQAKEDDLLAEFKPSFDTPIVAVHRGPDGLPSGATAVLAMRASPERVFSLVRAVESFQERVPMVHRSHRVGNRVHVEARFKVALFSAKFGFEAEIIEEVNRSLELRWISGEPHGMHIRYDIAPLEEGRASLVKTHASFDISSLGWLVKFFLRHHPEIQFGVFPGTALVLQDALRRALFR